MATPKRRGRRSVLDAEKRQTIAAMLSLGNSRRRAATAVGCAPSTITRTAAQDADFAARLVRAERAVEIEALLAIREAVKDPRHWRAAAWLLERKNPDDLVHHPPKTLTLAEVHQAMSALCDALARDLPEENYRRAKERSTDCCSIFAPKSAHEAGLTPLAVLPPQPPEPHDCEPSWEPRTTRMKAGGVKDEGGRRNGK